ncbi:MAG: hypothetical protein ACKVY0_08975 [Prosthecobacter sp.]|uniref:hypothetical protein n=1 Tax=Prosthecobacter sp. TaxID=1965333 RepID=UPI0039009864
MLISLHHVLFLLLPIALTARMVIKPRPVALDVAQGVMRFCLGFGKWVLLVDPLWHLSTIVLRGGPDSLSTSVAWMGFLALLLSLHFFFTAAGDLLAGLGGMLGFAVPDKIQDALTLQRLTQGKLIRLLVVLLVMTVLGVLLQTLSLGDTWLHLEAMFASPARTIATVFQQARVWTDYHAVTMFAALACLIGLPHSRDFLRVPAPWKGTICLSVFLLAVVMLWTHAAPMS